MRQKNRFFSRPSEYPLYGSSRLGNYMPQANNNTQAIYTLQSNFIRNYGDPTFNKNTDNTYLNSLNYELNDHLGNVTATLSDYKINQKVQLLSAHVYYPFGMEIQSRSAGSYRYGFNGKEKDNEISGDGNDYDLGSRFYNSKTIRMYSRDPREYEYPWQSPYVYHRNSPIFWLDYQGMGDPPFTYDPKKDREFLQHVCWAFLDLTPVGTIWRYDKRTQSPLSDEVVTNNDAHFEAAFELVFIMPGGKLAGKMVKKVTGSKVVKETVAYSLSHLNLDQMAIKTIQKGVAGGGVFVRRQFKNLEFHETKAWFKYQGQINGIRGSFEYLLNSVRFDGFKDGVLLEAKGHLQWLIKKEIVKSDVLYKKMQNQLTSQVTAAKGAKLEWHFAEKETMTEFKNYVKENSKELLEKVEFKVTKFEGK